MNSDGFFGNTDFSEQFLTISEISNTHIIYFSLNLVKRGNRTHVRVLCVWRTRAWWANCFVVCHVCLNMMVAKHLVRWNTQNACYEMNLGLLTDVWHTGLIVTVKDKTCLYLLLGWYTLCQYANHPENRSLLFLLLLYNDLIDNKHLSSKSEVQQINADPIRYYHICRFNT